MLRRLSGFILLALALAGSHHATVAAARPLYLVCSFPSDPNVLDLWILVDNFDGFAGAAHQCVFFWKGIPRGIVR
jgi:hypothetical protein